jgi:hypothetical protein
VDAGFEKFLAGGSPLLGGGGGVAQGRLHQGAVQGERGAQLVGGVGGEVPLGGERGFGLDLSSVPSSG